MSTVDDYYAGLIARVLRPLRLAELRRWLGAPPADCLPPERAFAGNSKLVVCGWRVLFGAVPLGPRPAGRRGGAPVAAFRAMLAQPWVAANLAVLDVLGGVCRVPGGGRLAAGLAAPGSLRLGGALGATPGDIRALRRAVVAEPACLEPACLEPAGANPRRRVFAQTLARALARVPAPEPGPWIPHILRLWDGEAVHRLRHLFRSAGRGGAGAALDLWRRVPNDGRLAWILPRVVARAAGAGAGLPLFLSLRFGGRADVEACVRALVPRDWPAWPATDPAFQPQGEGGGLDRLLAEAATAPSATRAAAAARLLTAFFGTDAAARILRSLPWRARRGAAAAALGLAGGVEPRLAEKMGLVELSQLFRNPSLWAGWSPAHVLRVACRLSRLRAARRASSRWRGRVAEGRHRQLLGAVHAELASLPPGPASLGGAGFLEALARFGRPRRLGPATPAALAWYLAEGGAAVACAAPDVLEGPAGGDWGLPPGSRLRLCAGEVCDWLAPGLLACAPAERLRALGGRPLPHPWRPAPAFALRGGGDRAGLDAALAARGGAILTPALPASLLLGRPGDFPPDIWIGAG